MSEFKDGFFRLDNNTLRSIEDLQRKLHADNSTEVIRNALALLKIAVDNANPDLIITMIARDGGLLRINLKATD